MMGGMNLSFRVVTDSAKKTASIIFTFIITLFFIYIVQFKCLLQNQSAKIGKITEEDIFNYYIKVYTNKIYL